MNIATIKQLPLQRIGALTTHPEPTHLRALHSMALSCGNGSLFVECGQTNGAVSYVLACALQHQPDSKLVILGQIPGYVTEMLTNMGVIARVSSAQKLDSLPNRAPDLVFIGAPEVALDATDWALARGARVICLYDVRTAERYRLAQFDDSALAATDLKNATDRSWNEMSNAISFEQARRGMLVSEAKQWVRPSADEKEAPPAKAAPVKPAPKVEAPAPKTAAPAPAPKVEAPKPSVVAAPTAKAEGPQGVISPNIGSVGVKVEDPAPKVEAPPEKDEDAQPKKKQGAKFKQKGKKKSS